MANVQGSDIVDKVRIYAAEPNSEGRWSDDDILSLGDDSCTAVSLRCDWPEAIFTTSTNSNVQEYALPEIVAILRVYVAGQLIFPSDIPALSGEQIEVFDQSTSVLAPQWTKAAAATYPVSNDRASPVPAVPYYPGQRPVFYLRGGNLGLVPAPLGIFTLQIDTVPIPVELTTISTQTNFPHIFLPALAHKTAELMFSADANDTAAASENAKYERAIGEIVTWKRNLVRNKPRRSYLYPYRLLTYGPFRR